MLKCAYCIVTAKNEAGLSAHVRRVHPGRWRKTLKDSLPPGFNMGTPEPRKVPAVAKRGGKKQPIKSDCPWCKFTSNHPPALARHIQGAHPDRWKHTLRKSLGHKVTETDKAAEIRRAKQRVHNANMRARYVAQGLTATGKPRKRARKKAYVPKQPDVSGRIPVRELPSTCPICKQSYSTRSILGQHTRGIHHMSLFDLPPYKPLEVTAEKEEQFQQDVAKAEEALRTYEEWPDDKVVITIQNGTTTLAGKNMAAIREAMEKLEK